MLTCKWKRAYSPGFLDRKNHYIGSKSPFWS